MIIIKTKDGDHFINEKELIEFAHDKNSATAYYYGQNAGSNRIENVESITYNDEKTDDGLTEKEVDDFYQERSVKAGERADQLAWMFVLMMTGGLISGHAFLTFSVCAALAVVYMLLSVFQAVWQTFTAWLFEKRIKNSDETFADYPAWVGCGSWFFFWLKMIAISTAVFYFVHPLIK